MYKVGDKIYRRIQQEICLETENGNEFNLELDITGEFKIEGKDRMYPEAPMEYDGTSRLIEHSFAFADDVDVTDSELDEITKAVAEIAENIVYEYDEWL